MTDSMTTCTVPQLCAAAESGDLAQVRRILADQPELARQDTASNNETQALHVAARANQPEAVQLLLEAGADPLNGIYPHRDATRPIDFAEDRGHPAVVEVIQTFLNEQRGATPAGQVFAAAVGEGNRARVTALLDGDPDLIRATDGRGQTGLFHAVRRPDAGMVLELLDRGAEVDHEDADGLRPLHRALCHAWKENDDLYPVYTGIGGLLIGRGARYDLWAAAAMGDADGVRQRLDTEGDAALAAHGDRSPVTAAAFRGHVEVLRVLLDAGADPDVPHTIDVAGETVEQWGQPLWLACNRGHYDVVELLLERGARANCACYASGNGVVQALFQGHHRTANLVFMHGGVADPLAYCISGDMAALAERMAAHPESRDGLRLDAIIAGNEVVLEHLLRTGPEPSVEDQFRMVQEAVRGWRLGNLKIDNEGWDRRSYVRNLERLLAHGCRADLRCPRAPDIDWTILHHLAAKACNPVVYGHTEDEVLEFARLLIDAGADVNAIEQQLQSTPLGWAARYGQLRLAEYLLKRGADPNRAGEDWARPLAWAQRKEREEIAALLEEHGAR